MPSISSPEVQDAKKKAIQAAQQRGGRASTILTAADKATDTKLG